MFEGWDSFFLLIGGAAGALIGLFFIVVTLMRGGGDPDVRLRAAGVYMTPTVAQLAMVLLLSAFATAPGLSPGTAGVALAAFALVCLSFAARAVVMLGLRRIAPSHWSDLWAYGVAPFAACLGLAASAAAVWLSPAWAARGVAASLMALLLIAIRNAWDLVTWITAQGDQLDKPRA